MIYSKNLSVAKTAAKQIAENHITRFHSQNALYIFMEDIKNPWIKNSGWYKSNRAAKMPGYQGDKNYGPSIKYLMSLGILKKNRGSYRVSYEVNKEALQNYVKTI